MAQFEIRYAATGCADEQDDRVADFVIDPVEAEMITMRALRFGELPQGVLSFNGVTIDEDRQPSDSETKVSIVANFLVDAADPEAARKLAMPDSLLAGLIRRIGDEIDVNSGFDVAGSWDVASVRPAPEPASYRYALVNRPADFSSLPRGLAYTVQPRPSPGQPHYTWARHGILETATPIPSELLKSFELGRIVEPGDLAALADRISRGDMGDYAGEYAAMATDDPEGFLATVLDHVGLLEPGVVQSISDIDVLSIVVARQLAVRSAEVEAQRASAERPL